MSVADNDTGDSFSSVEKTLSGSLFDLGIKGFDLFSLMMFLRLSGLNNVTPYCGKERTFNAS